MTHTRDNYHLTDELAHFDLPAVCALIQTASWATHRSLEQIAESVQQSITLVLTHQGETIGVVRALTDHSVNSYICDFVIDASHRGQKLGTWMLETLLIHPALARTQILLLTQDAQDFYQPHGFAIHPYTCMKKPSP
jgi:N-acetylglutamate synthase-like GNAT family acetyltransferase